jgi:hypothetical protein
MQSPELIRVYFKHSRPKYIYTLSALETKVKQLYMKTYLAVKQSFGLKLNYSVRGVLDDRKEQDEEDLEAVGPEEKKKSKVEWTKRVLKSWFKCEVKKNQSQPGQSQTASIKQSDDVSFIQQNQDDDDDRSFFSIKDDMARSVFSDSRKGRDFSRH